MPITPTRPVAPPSKPAPAAPARPLPSPPVTGNKPGSASGDALIISAAAQRQAATTLWAEPSPTESTFYRSERDPIDVNARAILKRERERDDLATAQVARGMAAERSVIEGFGDSIKELRFIQIAATMTADPQARLALQVLLLEGRLFKPGRDRTDLGHALAALATQPVAKGIDRNALVADLVQELADPVAIAQQSRGTCTVTSLQIREAIERPDAFVHVISGLASPAGTVKLANGDTVTRSPGTENPGGRSHSTALWAGAMMEYGNGDATYDNATDRNTPGGDGGLSSKQLAAVATALDPKHPVAAQWFFDNRGTQATLTEKIGVLANTGVRVPVSLKWGASGPDGKRFDGIHAVLVTAVTADRVTILNPHGAEQSLARDVFTERLLNACLPPVVPAPAPVVVKAS